MNHPVFIINIFDKEHRVLYWNHRCESFFGIAEANALGKLFEDLVPQAKGHHNQFYLDKALSGESVIVEYTPYEKKLGGFTQIILPLTNVKGSVIAAVSITKEIIADENKTDFFSQDKAASRFRHFFSAIEFTAY